MSVKQNKKGSPIKINKYVISISGLPHDQDVKGGVFTHTATELAVAWIAKRKSKEKGQEDEQKAEK